VSQFHKTDARLAALQLLASGEPVRFYRAGPPGQFRRGANGAHAVTFKIGEALTDLVSEKLASVDGRYVLTEPGEVQITREGRRTLGRWTTQQLTTGRERMLRRVAFGEMRKTYDGELNVAYVDRGLTRNGQDAKSLAWLERAGLIRCTGETNALGLREGPMKLRDPGRVWLEANPE
jgi:hypothetical protein